MNTKYIAAAVTTGVVLVGGGVLGVGAVAAQSEGDTNEYPLIIQNIAEAFGVGEEEVKTVFDDTREEKADARLDELVEEGELTQEQRDLLEAKHDEIHSQMEEIKDSDMTDEEKREAMKALHEEMRDWAEENGIELPGKIGNHKGKGHFRGDFGFKGDWR